LPLTSCGIRPDGRTCCGFSRKAARLGTEYFSFDFQQPAIVAARPVAGDAADLVIQLLAGGNEFQVDRCLLDGAGRTEEVDEGVNLGRLVRVTGERAGHRGARLDSLGIVEELADMADAGPAGDGIEDGGLFAQQRRVGGVAANAIELAEQELAALDGVGLGVGEKPFKAGDDGMDIGVRGPDAQTGNERRNQGQEQQPLPVTKHHKVPQEKPGRGLRGVAVEGSTGVRQEDRGSGERRASVRHLLHVYFYREG
jgi:hypothetical protein